MGLTLVAILTGALLLPGIIAAWSFYRAGQTPEVEAVIPSLSTPQGIALVGAFSVAVHSLYILFLKFLAGFREVVHLPPPDPYMLFMPSPDLGSSDAAWALFSGLTCLTLCAFIVGRIVGWINLLTADPSVFYGPLADVIESAKGDDKFITAYVLSKIEDGSRLVGYEGTVDSLFRDADRFPAKVVLKDVVPFYLELKEDSPVRHESDQIIDWMVVSSVDWHNIAFRVFQFIDEPAGPGQTGESPDDSAEPDSSTEKSD